MPNDMEDIDMDAVVKSVIDDMGNAAKAFKAKRYELKPKLNEEAQEGNAPELDSGEHAMPSASELESLLGH